MRILISFIAAMVTTVACAGAANWYVDPSYDGGNGASNGSFARPWTTIVQVNGATLADGDDLYFRAGRSVSVAQAYLKVGWTGLPDNPSVIGAYYIVSGAPVHGLPPGAANLDPVTGDGDRPVLDGANWNEAGTGWRWEGAIHATNKRGYYTIENLSFYRTPGPGVVIKSLAKDNPYSTTTGSIVRNCRFFETFRQGVVLVQNTGAVVEGCYVWRASYGPYVIMASSPGSPYYQMSLRVTGAGIEISGQGQAAYSRDNIVRGNTARQCFEGVGLYLQTTYSTIENNVILDNRNVNLYVANSRYNTVRNNLVYFTTEKRSSSAITGGGLYDVANILVDNEAWTLGSPSGYHHIYDNFTANGRAGVQINNQNYEAGPGNEGHVGHRISRNRIVNATANLRIRWVEASAANLTGAQRSYIWSNYSFGYRADVNHAEVGSYAGYVWGVDPNGQPAGNYYTPAPGAGGIAGTNAVVGAVALQKTTGWDTLVPLGLSYSDFALTGETTQGCGSDSAFCTTEEQCALYWPAYYWVPEEAGCQPMLGSQDPDCNNDYRHCMTMEECLSAWPDHHWCDVCQPAPCPVFEQIPFGAPPVAHSSDLLPRVLSSEYPDVRIVSGAP